MLFRKQVETLAQYTAELDQKLARCGDNLRAVDELNRQIELARREMGYLFTEIEQAATAMGLLQFKIRRLPTEKQEKLEPVTFSETFTQRGISEQQPPPEEEVRSYFGRT